INQMIEATKENNEVLNNKNKSLKDNQNTLLDGFNGYLDKYFNTFLEKLKLGFEKRTNEITEDFSSIVKENEEQVKQHNKKNQDNGTIIENTIFIFAYFIYVIIAIVLSINLSYSLWEGFNVKGF